MGCCTDRDDGPKRVVGEGGAGFCCTDILFAVLFVANLVPIFYLFYEFQSDTDIGAHLNSTFARITSEELDDDIYLGLRAGGYGGLGAIAFVIIWIVLCRYMPTLLILLAQLLAILSCLVGAFVFIIYYEALEMTSTHGYMAGGLLLLLAVIVGLYLICIRKRIAFTAVILGSVAKVLMRTPELFLIKLVMGVIVLLYACIWAGSYLELMAQIDEYSFDNESQAYGYWALGNLYALLSLFWVQFTLLNVAFVTVCATVGAWYFSPGTFGRGCFCCRKPVWWGLLRALTCSFGSIAFGSLILALMRTIIVACQYLADKAQKSGGQVAALVCCCFICCLQCLEKCLTWLTEYAFVYVALYGTGFCTSGVRVFQMLSTSGAKALIQQTLLSPLEYMAGGLGLAVGMGCGYAAHLNEGDLTLSDEARHLQVGVALLCGGSVGYLVMAMGTAVIDAGCKTLFVCFAEEPTALRDLAPELFATFNEAKPIKGKGADKDKTDPLIAP